jgi:hypothetical protein
MGDGIYGYPAEISGRIVPKTIRHPCVRRLVDAQRKKQNGELDRYSAEINMSKKVHSLFLFRIAQYTMACPQKLPRKQKMVLLSGAFAPGWRCRLD